MGGSFLSPEKRGCYLIPIELSAVLRQVGVACFRTCLTKNGSQRGRAPAGQRPQPPSGGAPWPRPATQHRPPPLAGAPSGGPGAGSRPTAYWWVDLRWPHEAVSFSLESFPGLLLRSRRCPLGDTDCERAAMSFAQSPRGCSIKPVNACLYLQHFEN
jgi:hypothetical protein